MNDDERPYLLLFSASTIIVHQIIHMVANAFNKSWLTIQISIILSNELWYTEQTRPKKHLDFKIAKINDYNLTVATIWGSIY